MVGILEKSFLAFQILLIVFLCVTCPTAIVNEPIFSKSSWEISNLIISPGAAYNPVI